jgi:hypothetical protein
MQLGGKNYDLKTPYFPAALGATKSDSVNDLKQKWIEPTGSSKQWSYQGTGLEEDELGEFEKEILDQKDGKKLFGHGYKVPHATNEPISV